MIIDGGNTLHNGRAKSTDRVHFDRNASLKRAPPKPAYISNKQQSQTHRKLPLPLSRPSLALSLCHRLNISIWSPKQTLEVKVFNNKDIYLDKRFNRQRVRERCVRCRAWDHCSNRNATTKTQSQGTREAILHSRTQLPLFEEQYTIIARCGHWLPPNRSGH